MTGAGRWYPAPKFSPLRGQLRTAQSVRTVIRRAQKRPKARLRQVETQSRLSLLFARDLFGKPVPTFPDHALAPRVAQKPTYLISP